MNLASLLYLLALVATLVLMGIAIINSAKGIKTFGLQSLPEIAPYLASSILLFLSVALPWRWHLLPGHWPNGGLVFASLAFLYLPRAIVRNRKSDGKEC